MDGSIDKAARRLILALDVPSVDEARALAKATADHVGIFKIGHRLAFTGGLDLADELIGAGHQVFLDLKLLDIDQTVENGVAALAGRGISMLTVHAYPKAMAAAIRGAAGSAMTLLGVTVLTSMDDDDLKDAGYGLDAEALVARRAAQARDCGMGGLVCSAREAASVRSVVGGAMAIVTPGIRPAGAQSGDQKRVATPADAIASGASHLVIGRPILQASDPAAAAKAIHGEIAAALDKMADNIGG